MGGSLPPDLAKVDVLQRPVSDEQFLRVDLPLILPCL